VLHNGILYDQSKVKVTEADFKVYLFCWYACNQKTNVDLWYSKAVSKF